MSIKTYFNTINSVLQNDIKTSHVVNEFLDNLDELKNSYNDSFNLIEQKQINNLISVKNYLLNMSESDLISLIGKAQNHSDKFIVIVMPMLKMIIDVLKTTYDSSETILG